MPPSRRPPTRPPSGRRFERSGSFGPLLRGVAAGTAVLVLMAAAVVGPRPVRASGPSPVPRLQVRSDDGALLVDLPLPAPAAWEVRWNHSVTGVLVSDFYRYERGRMVLVASHTPAFDAGLGQIPGRGIVRSDGRHGYWITGIDEPVPGNAYLLRVGSRAVDHRLVVAGRVVSLSRMAEHRRVRVAVVAP